MKLVIGLVLLIPWLWIMILCFGFDVPFIESLEDFGSIWIGFSPIWALFIAVLAFTYGRTIEVIENVKDAYKLANDNKHHIKSALDIIKEKVSR